MDTMQWAREEFGTVDLGDKRLTQRAVDVGERLAACAGRSLPKAMGGWTELVGAYRLFGNEAVTLKAIVGPHQGRVRELLTRGQGCFLLVEDTTELDFTRADRSEADVRGLGRIGDDSRRGAFAHVALAFEVTGGQGLVLEVRPVGLANVKTWVRGEKVHKGNETRTQRNKRRKESDRWGCWLKEIGGPPPGAAWVFVADRESDIYELLAERVRPGTDFVVRASQARCTEQGADVFDLVGRAAMLGTIEVHIPQREGRPARNATLEIKSAHATIRPPARVPARKRRHLELNIVEAREPNPPEGQEPLCWVLLTSLAIETLADCETVIGIYRQRWQVEDYFKCLKTGTRIQKARLHTWRALSALLAFLLVVAVRLLELKWFTRQDQWPDDAERPDDALLNYLVRKTRSKEDVTTPRGFYRTLARLGGFLGRKSDGEPGWQAIWDGLLQALAFLDALEHLAPHRTIRPETG